MFDLRPYKRKDDVFDQMLETFQDVFHRNFPIPFQSAKSFRTDIVEKDNAYYVQAELPGFKKDDITIEITDNYLTIRAKRDEMKQVEEKDKYIHRERSYGEFVRQFYVNDADQDNIKAKLEDGILHIEIPKLHSDKRKGRRIEIL